MITSEAPIHQVYIYRSKSCKIKSTDKPEPIRNPKSKQKYNTKTIYSKKKKNKNQEKPSSKYAIIKFISLFIIYHQKGKHSTGW